MWLCFAPMTPSAGQYMKTLEEQVKAQALLITKLQSELTLAKNEMIKVKTQLEGINAEEQ